MSSGYGLQLEDVITIHVMEGCVSCPASALPRARLLVVGVVQQAVSCPAPSFRQFKLGAARLLVAIYPRLIALARRLQTRFNDLTEDLLCRPLPFLLPSLRPSADPFASSSTAGAVLSLVASRSLTPPAMLALDLSRCHGGRAYMRLKNTSSSSPCSTHEL